MNKVITYKWHKERKFGVFAISEEDYNLVKGKLEFFEWEGDRYNEFSENEDLYYINRPFAYSKPFSQVATEQIAVLIQNGFTLDKYAQKQYEYWGGRYAEILARREKEREQSRLYKEQRKIEEQKRLEEIQKELEKRKVTYWTDGKHYYKQYEGDRIAVICKKSEIPGHVIVGVV